MTTQMMELETLRKLPKKDFWLLLENLLETDQEQANEAIFERCRFDLETFIQIVFPHYTEYPFNQFHRDVFKYYEKPKRGARTMDAAPRGYAKSAVKALFKPIHDICYDYEKFILFVSATKDQARGKLTDIRSEILTNPILRPVFGVHFLVKNPGSDKFIVCSKENEIMFQAVGKGTELRGIRFREARPSKIILDDAEDSDEIENEDLREKDSNWFKQVISQLGSKTTNIEAVGTILHRDSLLKKLEKNPVYKSKIYKAVIEWSDNASDWAKWKDIVTDLDNDNRDQEAKEFFEARRDSMLRGTKVLWPEKESYYELMLLIVEIGKRAFMKEKQNDPQGAADAIFDNMQYYYEDAERGGLIVERTKAFIPYKDLTAYGSLDPATGETRAKSKGKLDYSCVLGGYKDLKGRLFVHRDWTKRAKPTEYIKQIFEMYDEMHFNKFVVETNLYRNLLMENLVRARKELEIERKKEGVENWGIKVPFYEIDNRDKKEKRILTLEPKVNNGYILFNKRTISPAFTNQMEAFPNKDAHDDGPDALEMLWGLVTNRYKASPVDVQAKGSH